ncbi:MAG: hypothetical protein HZA04_07800 [Nitrospinae bacterium]|nr:hypothetical protein [Nitrospinota bacterium]
MKNLAGAAAFALMCFAIIIFGFLYPPEMKDRPASRTAADIAFGGTEKFILVQPFHSGLDNLSGFALAVNNPGGRTFELRVHDSSGAVNAVVRTNERISGVDKIRFPAIEGSSGKEYMVELETLNAGPRMDFMGATDAGGGLTANGATTGCSLFFQPIASAGPAEKANTLLRRIKARKPFSAAAFITLNFFFVGTLFGAAYFCVPHKVK